MFVQKLIVLSFWFFIASSSISVGHANLLFFSGSISSTGCKGHFISGHIKLACRDNPAISDEIFLGNIDEGHFHFRGIKVKIHNLRNDNFKKIVLLDYY
ncbi:TPA: hypothetical protein ACG0DQ_004276 [Enterobacter kobei]|jgi:hypothetical protein